MTQGSKTCKGALFMLMILCSSVPALAAATCCVSCRGIIICGVQVSTECGECNSSPGTIPAGQAPGATASVKSLDLTLSVGEDKPRTYKIRGAEGATIKDEQSGASYFVQPRRTGSSIGPAELNVKRVFDVLGLQLSFDYGSIQMQQKSTGNPALRAGPISIWSAGYDKEDKVP